MIYFIEHGGRIKVGYAKSIENRLKDFRTTIPTFVRLGSMEGSREHERTIHESLSSYRLEGEWFRDCPEVRQFLMLAMKEGVRETPAVSRGKYAPSMWDQRAKRLTEIVCAGQSAEQIKELEKQHSIPLGTMWKLRYRQEREVSVGEYFSLISAARTIVSVRREALERDAAFISDLEREDADSTNETITIERRMEAYHKAKALLGTETSAEGGTAPASNAD